MATTYLTKQISSAGTNRTKATISLWVKIGDSIGNDQRFFSYENTSVSNNVTVFKFVGLAGGSMGIQFADQTGGSNNARFDGTRALRDPSAWYHFVVKADTTQVTNTDRLKIYINGELQTSTHGSYTYPSQNSTLNFGHNANAYIDIGRWRGSNNQYFDGSMTHFHYTDGYAYDASTFGETDSTSGIWKAKSSASVTYGNNGFFLKMENSGAMGTDSSGNTNTFTVSGSLTQNVDTPDNNFCTWNPLTQNGGTYLNGNTTRTGGDDTGASMGVTNGKWYWEMKKANTTAGNHFGICSTSSGFNNSSLQMLNGESGSVGASIWLSLTGTAATGYGNAAGFSNVNYSGISSVSIANGDIVGCALDISTSSGTLTFYKNGSSLGAATFTYDQKTPVFPFIRNNSGATTDTNFGSGFFGTTAVASANADGNGIGKMEYAVPTGYYTLNTKNLKEFG